MVFSFDNSVRQRCLDNVSKRKKVSAINGDTLSKRKNSEFSEIRSLLGKKFRVLSKIFVNWIGNSHTTWKRKVSIIKANIYE